MSKTVTEVGQGATPNSVGLTPPRCYEDCESPASHACIDCERPGCPEHVTEIAGTDGDEWWCGDCRDAHTRAVVAADKRIAERNAREANAEFLQRYAPRDAEDAQCMSSDDVSQWPKGGTR